MGWGSKSEFAARSVVVLIIIIKVLYVLSIKEIVILWGNFINYNAIISWINVVLPLHNLMTIYSSLIHFSINTITVSIISVPKSAVQSLLVCFVMNDGASTVVRQGLAVQCSDWSVDDGNHWSRQGHPSGSMGDGIFGILHNMHDFK